MSRTKTLSGLLFFGLICTFGVLWFYKISEVTEHSISNERVAARQAKKAIEIERIIDKTYNDYKLCEQYALVALSNGWFPCFRCSGKDSIFLYEGEVWKYGKTCLGEEHRYASGFPTTNLRFQQQFKGTEKECLLMEKEKIYNYPNLPECRKRDFVLLRPPGNKIDR